MRDQRGRDHEQRDLTDALDEDEGRPEAGRETVAPGRRCLPLGRAVGGERETGDPPSPRTVPRDCRRRVVRETIVGGRGRAGIGLRRARQAVARRATSSSASPSRQQTTSSAAAPGTTSASSRPEVMARRGERRATRRASSPRPGGRPASGRGTAGRRRRSARDQPRRGTGRRARRGRERRWRTRRGRRGRRAAVAAPPTSSRLAAIKRARRAPRMGTCRRGRAVEISSRQRWERLLPIHPRVPV